MQAIVSRERAHMPPRACWSVSCLAEGDQAPGGQAHGYGMAEPTNSDSRQRSGVEGVEGQLLEPGVGDQARMRVVKSGDRQCRVQITVAPGSR